MFAVIDLEKFKCGFKNCHSAFSSEFLIDEHFRLKHNGQKKLIATVKNAQNVIETLLETEKYSWIPNLTYNSTIPMKMKRNPKEETKQHLLLNCLKCGKTVSTGYTLKERHIFQHVQDKIKCQDIFRCLLCPTDKVYTTICRANMRVHLIHVHRVNDNVRKYYFDNRYKYLNVIQSVAIECFGEPFYTFAYISRLLKPKNTNGGDDGAPSLTNVHVHCSNSTAGVSSKDNGKETHVISEICNYVGPGSTSGSECFNVAINSKLDSTCSTLAPTGHKLKAFMIKDILNNG